MIGKSAVSHCRALKDLDQTHPPPPNMTETLVVPHYPALKDLNHAHPPHPSMLGTLVVFHCRASKDLHSESYLVTKGATTCSQVSASQTHGQWQPQQYVPEIRLSGNIVLQSLLQGHWTRSAELGKLSEVRDLNVDVWSGTERGIVLVAPEIADERKSRDHLAWKALAQAGERRPEHHQPEE